MALKLGHGIGTGCKEHSTKGSRLEPEMGPITANLLRANFFFKYSAWRWQKTVCFLHCRPFYLKGCDVNPTRVAHKAKGHPGWLVKLEYSGAVPSMSGYLSDSSCWKTEEWERRTLNIQGCVYLGLYHLWLVFLLYMLVKNGLSNRQTRCCWRS